MGAITAQIQAHRAHGVALSGAVIPASASEGTATSAVVIPMALAIGLEPLVVALVARLTAAWTASIRTRAPA